MSKNRLPRFVSGSVSALAAPQMAFPMPIPIVLANGSWHFDATAGAQEIINRQIGRSEIAAIRTSLAYADGQEACHAGFGTYATRPDSTGSSFPACGLHSRSVLRLA